MKRIGTMISARRKMLRLSQRQLADIADVGINTLTKIERGEANPTVGILGKVLDALGLELVCKTKTIGDEAGERIQ